MNTDLGTKLLEDYHRGGLSRREVVARLVGLGAAMAVSGNAAAEGTTATSTFAGTRVGHIALDVTDVARSHAFEEEYLGLRTMGDGGDQRSFLAPVGGQFIPALLRSDAHPLLPHHSRIQSGRRGSETARRGRRTTMRGGRVYFPDPDGLAVQLAKGPHD